MHYYKFNIADWHLGTSHLSLVEEAIYFRLINHYYDTESPIPLETQSVFRRLRLGSESDSAQQILDEFFKKTEKGYVHVRCEENIKEYKKTEKKNKLNGAKGGRPRKIKASSETQEKPTGLIVGTQAEPKHNPNHKPITNNHKPITNNQSEKAEKRNAMSAQKQKTPVDKFFDDDTYLEIQREVRPDLTDSEVNFIRGTFALFWNDQGALRDDWPVQWRKWVLAERKY
jgi:uncharacterized protein YdaU (DUF1376 family)